MALSTVPSIEVRILATTLALGLLIDAVIVRGALGPALVAVFADANWTLPWPLAAIVRPGYPDRPTARRGTANPWSEPDAFAAAVSGGAESGPAPPGAS